MTSQGEGHKSNSYSIISIAYGGVELKSLCEEEPGCENTEVMSGEDVDDGKMNSVMVAWDVVKILYAERCAVSAVWIQTMQGKYIAAYFVTKN